MALGGYVVFSAPSTMETTTDFYGKTLGLPLTMTLRTAQQNKTYFWCGEDIVLALSRRPRGAASLQRGEAFNPGCASMPAHLQELGWVRLRVADKAAAKQFYGARVSLGREKFGIGTRSDTINPPG